MYSKKRLMVLALLFTAAIIIHPPAMDVSVPEEIVAEAGHYCETRPCEFPGEHGESGIVFGVNEISAPNIHYRTNDVAKGIPNRARDEPTVEIGLDDINPEQFFVYKGWRYYDYNTGQYANTYVWLNTTNAIQLDEGGNKADGGCSGSDNCDLITYASEVGARRLQGNVAGINLNLNNWGTDPEDDEGCLSPTLNAGGCYDATIRVDDGIFRVHNISVGGHPKSNEVERLRLSDVYVEIRYGTGRDRAYDSIPDSDRPACCGTDDNSPWSTPYFESYFALNRACEGFSNHDCSTFDTVGPSSANYDVGLDYGEVYTEIVSADSGNYEDVTPAKPYNYNTNVVIAGPFTNRGSDPAHPRLLYDIDGCCSGDTIRFQAEEWDYDDQGHIDEKTGYVALDHGSEGGRSYYDLNNNGNDDVVAGSFTADVSDGSNTATPSYNDIFSGKPVVFTQIGTNRGSQAVWGEVDGVTQTDFGYRMFDLFQNSDNEDSDGHSDEDVGFIAFDIAELGNKTENQQFINNGALGFPDDNGTAYLSDPYRSFEVGKHGPVSEQFETINFGGNYKDPVFIARVRDGGGPDIDDGHLRYRNLDGNSVEVAFEEPNDASHSFNGGSKIAYLVFDNADRYEGVLSGGIANPYARPIQAPGGQADATDGNN